MNEKVRKDDADASDTLVDAKYEEDELDSLPDADVVILLSVDFAVAVVAIVLDLVVAVGVAVAVGGVSELLYC